MCHEIFIDKQGRKILLRYDDPEERISAYHDEKEIGEFLFRLVEYETTSGLLVMSMYLDYIPGYKRNGISTTIIRLAERLTEYEVVFGKDNGSEGSCSSHLTGDGPNFAASFSPQNT